MRSWVFKLFVGALFIFATFLAAKAENGRINEALPSREMAGEKNPFAFKVSRMPGGMPDDFVTVEQVLTASDRTDPFEINRIDQSLGNSNNKAARPILIIINSSLYGNLVDELDQFMIDLSADGYQPDLFTSSGGTVYNIKQFLSDRYNSTGLEGAIFIGDLPTAFFEMDDCWSESSHESFPCDLYFMDLDGVWNDNNSNEIFDEHTGSVAPEIYIGRLSASTLAYGGSSEADLIRNYFQKNHNYRTGLLTVANRGLIYLDDDWAYDSTYRAIDMKNAYDSVVTIADVQSTTAGDYKDQLALDYEIVHLAVHSYANRHYFKNNFQWHSYFYPSDIVEIEPRAIFYSLFACTAGNFLQPDYMAGWYIFQPSSGLASIGTSKTGGMQNYNYLFRPLGENQSIGKSFVSWFTAMALNGYADWEICWFYGLILFGDPTLTKDMSQVLYPLEVMEKGLPNGTIGFQYSAQLSAGGGTPPYTWKIAGGGLPPGLTLDAQTGIISGLPSVGGIFYFEAEAIDTATVPRADTADFNITIICQSGDANGDNTINIGDVVYLVYHIFYDGPAPDPIERGDCNDDQDVNIADAVYLLNFIFNHGPVPICP